jgi:acetylglutamate kinase
VDLGLVGEITGVNTVYLNLLLTNGIMPVIAPIGVNDAGEAHNINADVAASAIAAELKAEKLGAATSGIDLGGMLGGLGGMLES